ncbi:unnamed protein product [Urochloa humidicola]
MAHVLIFLLLAHLLILLNPIAILAAESTNISEIDRQALLDFRQGITSDPLGVLSAWGKDSLYCNWRGVTCGLIIPKSLVEVGGTIGYMAPEYGMGSEITTGGDVYSFGVLLLEMLTGKQPTDDLFVDGLNLHNFTYSMFPDKLAEIIDPYMMREESQQGSEVWMQSYIIPLLALGLSCSMESPKDRPGMRDVCAKISAIKEDFLKYHAELSSLTGLVTGP